MSRLPAANACILFATAMFLLCWLLPAAQITPSGVQCPLASVQSVVVPVKDCCHKVIGYKVRAPHPGDKCFVQCRCAEKKAAQQKSYIEPKPTPYFAEILIMPRITAIPEGPARSGYSASCICSSKAPLLMPPISA